MWQQIEPMTTSRYTTFETSYGFWFWVLALYGNLLIVATIILLIRTAVKQTGLYRQQSLLLLAVTVISWVAVHLDIFDLTTIDISPFSFAVGAAIIGWGIRRYQLFDIRPIARRLVVDNMADGVMVLDAQERVVDINGVAERIIGRSLTELMGQTIHDVLAPLPFTFDQEQVEFITGDEPHQRHYDKYITPLRDEKGQLQGHIIAFRDITSYKQAQQEQKQIAIALRQSEERYRDLFENASDMIQSVDKDGRFLYVNQRWRQTLGYSQDEVSQMSFTDIVHPDYLAHCQTIFHQLIIGIPTQKIETVFVGKSGQTFTVEGHLNAQFHEGQFVATRGFFRDISQRKQVEQELRQSEEWLRSIIASMDDLVFVLDKDGIFLDYYQPKNKDGLYVPATQFLGKAYTEVLPSPIVEGLTAVLDQIAQTHQVQSFEYSLRVDGQTRWFSANVSSRKNNEGQYDGATIVARDITAYKEAGEQLRKLALRDSLTNLPNRTLFIEQLEQAIGQSQTNDQSQYAVLFLDLDRFKIINDSLGHQVGDELLVAIARQLENCIRQKDVVARLGGDEFVVLLNNIRTKQEVIHVAQRILENLATPLYLQGHEIFTSASIGVLAETAQYQNPAEVLRDADIAMYQAKAGGKARYELFDLRQQSQLVDMWQIESDLRHALAHDELRVYYLPIVSVTNGRLVGVEALVRWQHSQRGLLDPDIFLPIAEETGLIIPLNQWVLRQACADMHCWQQAGHDPVRLSVNIRASQLSQANAASFILDTLHEFDIPPHLLGLEITERFSARNADQVAVLHTLRGYGIHTLIDDFGIGSSLESLKLLPLDYLKINQAFVRGMTTEVKDRAIIRAMIAMVHSLKLKVIAEGVETAEQLAFLQAEGCDEVQGFLISRPVTAAAIQKMLQANSEFFFVPTDEEKMLLPTIHAQISGNIGFALVDKNLTVLKNNVAITQWGESNELNWAGRPLADFFPALLGSEQLLHELMNDPQAEPYILPRIYQAGGNEIGRYYDLRLEPFHQAEAILLVTALDTTQQAQQEFALRQQLNELRLVTGRLRPEMEQLK